MLLVISLASADELNQSFQASRTSSGWDVLLDIFGGISALAAFKLFRRRAQNKIERDS